MTTNLGKMAGTHSQINRWEYVYCTQHNPHSYGTGPCPQYWLPPVCMGNTVSYSTLHHNYTVHWALCYTCISTSWLTFFAATLDVPTTSPFSSNTSMPVLSSLFLISTTLHTLPVTDRQENEERGASRAVVSAATNTYCSHIQ